MNRIKIGVVEDELIVAYDICALLTDMGCEALQPCADYNEAVLMLERDQPDLVILDIMLGTGQDGIDLARHIRAGRNIPILFLTANSDPATVARARETLPDAYLIKPFHKAQLYSAIEVAIFAHQKRIEQAAITENVPVPLSDTLFVKDGDFLYRISCDDIVYLSSNQNYVVIQTTTRRFLIRATLQEYLQKLDPARFIRVHRSHAVNVHKLDKVGAATVILHGHEIPVSKNYADALYQLLGIG